MCASPNIIVISDLHLGAPSSLLAISSVSDRLAETLEQCGDITAFVLLGDILDLTRAAGADAWNEASRFLGRLFGRVARTASIYYVPGNHDHHLWTLLVEQKGLVRPLERTLDGPGATGRRSAVLNQVEWVGHFGPDDETFAHALFPSVARDRVQVWYPFLPLPLKDRVLFAHHGHYFDPRITPLATSVAARYKGDVGKVEECNAAWIEGLWYFASLGRIPREFATRALAYYQIAESIMKALQVSLGRVDDIGGLSLKRIKDMLFYLFNKESYVLVMGHTHRQDEYRDEASAIEIYNTGGWLVENWGESQPTVSPAILQAHDGGFRWLPFRVEPSEIQESAIRAKNVFPLR